MQKTFTAKTALVITLASLSLFGCQQKSVTTQLGSKTDTKTATVSTPTTNKPTTMQLQKPQTGDTIATIETTKGTIKFKLFTDLTPETAKNFIELAKAGKYDNVPFHRVIKNFMIQTGDFTNKNGTGGYSYKGPGTKIDNETPSQLKHLNGTVSMANAGPNTNGSQFFIVSNPNGTPHLNGDYSIFGQVFEGQDVVDAIASAKTGARDLPVEEILMKKVTISVL